MTANELEKKARRVYQMILVLSAVDSDDGKAVQELPDVLRALSETAAEVWVECSNINFRCKQV